METLISKNLFWNLNPQFPSSLSRSKFRSNPSKKPYFPQFWNCKSEKSILFTVSASDSTSYGGWEELNLIEDSTQIGKFDKFRNFLVSVGINDKKYVFVFVLGFVSALAVSRVSVSSVLVFPACVVVFVVGFSLGLIRRSGFGVFMNNMSRNGGNNGYKEEGFRVFVEKMRDFCNEVDVKVNFLEKEVNLAIDSNHGYLGKFSDTVKSISFDIGQAKNLVEASISDVGAFGNVGESKGDSVENRDIERNLNQKSSGRKKEQGGVSFDFNQLIGGLLGEYLIGMKHSKLKDSGKKKSTETLNSKMASNEVNGNNLNGKVQDKEVVDSVNKIRNAKLGTYPKEASSNLALNQQGAMIEGKEEISMAAISNSNESLNGEDLTLRFIHNHGNFANMHNHYKNEMPLPIDNLRDPFKLNRREMEIGTYDTEALASLKQEQPLKTSNGDYIPSFIRNKRVNGSDNYDFNKGKEILEGVPNIEEDSASSSSMISEDLVFDKHLTQATDLLKQARECLKGTVDEERAEVILYKSARLLSRAIAMKPMSLLAVGQLGNTYLLHGELKLRISRELRTLFSSTGPISWDKGRRVQLKGLYNGTMSQDKIASVLVDVCEECEELLVEAGRKYKTALAIDGSDVRALYNWGLALSFRAQLIADIGPGAAFDADKVYLAAIDKFDAMMSKSSVYAPEALFRWGMTLQQRSRLKPNNNREKIKLLHQAKRLFEDALSMDSNNLQVREALSSCLSELNYWQF
ncbi:hypothetical protein GIB67_021231 [Kingdonia uniflora]|uniref:Uncharacterized protein n=1 Tax=Kingdonia uniflora TaxID=39325 RepID=A0A7J7LFJ7_9MAGN|nr:hypothetical protein GIB67_021231 [Kingdonia uniflora]